MTPISSNDPNNTRRQRLRKIVPAVAISLLITLTLGVFVAHRFLPDLHRKLTLDGLLSNDAKTRDEAKRYVIAYAPTQPAVLQGAIERLEDADPQQFMHIVEAIDLAGRWRREHVPDRLWLRWVELLMDQQDAGARLLAVERAALLGDVKAEGRITALLRRAADDPEPMVRRATVFALMQTRANGRGAEHLAILHHLADDKDDVTARDAWLFLGLLRSASGRSLRIDPGSRPDHVLQAMLWAAMHTNPDQPDPGLYVLNHSDAHPVLRASAAWMLGESGTAAGQAALIERISQAPGGITDDTVATMWTAIRYVPIDRRDPKHPGTAALIGYLARSKASDFDDPLRRWPLLAAIHRVPELLRHPSILAAEDSVIGLLDKPLPRIAAVEGMPAGSEPLRFAPGMSEVRRLATARAAQTLQASDIEPAFSSSIAPFRDIACLIAHQRLPEESRKQMIERLLTGFDVNARYAAAMLDALGKLHTTTQHDGQPMDVLDLRIDRTRYAEQWVERQIYLVAKWLRDGDGEQVSQHHVTGYLAREDLPHSSILLALMHRGDQAAFDHLLTPWRPERSIPLTAIDPDHQSIPRTMKPQNAPPESPEIEVVDLLIAYRWKLVLDRYLPEDAPRIDLWSDGWLQQFQLDQLRYWYMLNREKVKPTRK